MDICKLVSIVLVTLTISFSGSIFAETYCAVEIGSKGIKGRIFELEIRKDCAIVAEQIYNRNENIDLVATMSNGQFTDGAIEAAAIASARLMNAMQSRSPNCKTFIVGSSGVAKATNLDALAKAVEEKSGLPKMSFIDAKREAEYGYYSAVDDRDRAKSLLVDIGSGNTKFGYIDRKRKFMGAELPFGSVTFAKQFDVTKSLSRFDLARSAMADVLPEFRSVTNDHPEILARPRILWVGGAAWATAMYSHPEAVEKPFISISRRDIEDFLVALENDNWKERIPPKKLSPEQLRDWTEQWTGDKGVTNVFKNTNQLLSGIFLMKVILSDGLTQHPVIFPHKAQWIYGYAATLFRLEHGHDACGK